jgi:dTDP-glucose 4,6-dehydratase
MKLFVTGGAGFIGGNFVHWILRERPEDSVLCYDALTYAGNLETLAPVIDDPRFCFVKGDITDRAAVEKAFAEFRPDAVINFAAESHVDRSIVDPGLFLRTNILGTGVLLDACRKFGGMRFHQVSTDEVYGDLPLDRPDLFFTEETPLHTSSPYSASKAAADLLVQSYWRTYRLPVTISRCSNNYGPWHFPEKLIPLVITRALNDETIPVYGRGENVRDWLYVEDHARAIDTIFHHGKIAETYNIGGFNEWKNIDIIKVLIRTTDRLLGRPEGADLDLITFVTDRAGHDLRYAIDSTKLQRELGWEPSLQFEEGIERTVRWYLDNQDWLDNVTSGDYQKYYEQMYAGR